MNDDLIAWYVYWAFAVINILLILVIKKQEFYKDGVTLFDVFMMFVGVFTPVINLMIGIFALFLVFYVYGSEIIILKPKQRGIK